MKLVTAAEMRQLENICEERGTSTSELMERAGLGVAREVKALAGALGRRFLILIGPGNNGGDGLVAARYLHLWGARVAVYLCRQREDENLRRAMELGIPCRRPSDDGLLFLEQWLKTADGVIDALFGTGKLRPLEGPYKEALERLAQAKRERPQLKIFALDLPSGLDADSGAVDPACVPADVTITLGYPKRGLFISPGSEKIGELRVVDIGLPEDVDIPTELISDKLAATLLPPRPRLSHKGTFGRVLVIAGSANYIGAACLASEGALRIGAGLVTLASPQSLHPIFAAKLTEVTHIPLPEEEPGCFSPVALTLLEEWLPRYDVVVLGCGLGQREATRQFLFELLPRLRDKLLVLDADGLNLLSQINGWPSLIPEKTILTPHPMEMSRLCNMATSEIQRERIETARRWAGEWQKIIVLKGAYTVVASPEGRVRLCPIATPALASAGTGDVLAGAIGGLLSQGLSPFDAASLGVYLHALAGKAAESDLGNSGVIASDLLLRLPRVMKTLREKG